VRGHELTTRQELLRDEPDHPNARHEYYKLQLGPLDKLPDPILARKWRRITFFYTTGEYLLRAKSVDDLVIQSGERPLLWRALHERAGGDFSGTAQQEPVSLDLDPATLAFLLGFRQADRLKSQRQ
jgi:hypothetical protein